MLFAVAALSATAALASLWVPEEETWTPRTVAGGTPTEEPDQERRAA